MVYREPSPPKHILTIDQRIEVFKLAIEYCKVADSEQRKTSELEYLINNRYRCLCNLFEETGTIEELFNPDYFVAENTWSKSG